MFLSSDTTNSNKHFHYKPLKINYKVYEYRA